IFDPLIDVTNDSRFVPALAEAWEAENDTTWRFTLRKGVTFHDGSPFNADSVVYTLRRVRDDSRLIKSFVYQDLDAIEPDGEHAVKVTSKRPFGSLPSHLTMLGILPAGAAGKEEGFFQKPIGTGPFRLAEWTRAAGLRAGEFQVIDRVPPDMVHTLRASPGVRVMSGLGLEVQQWLFQLAKDPDKDLRLRKAISLGIDRDAIIKDLLLGFARPAVCPIPPGLVGHTDLGVKPHDPDRARALLKEAGYRGESLDFVLMKDLYPKQLEVTQAVQAMLGEIGVVINIKNMQIATARERRSAGRYDMV